MGTILRIRIKNLLSSIRFQVVVALLLVVGIAFIAVGSTLLGMAGDYLFEELDSSNRLFVRRLSDQLSPLDPGKDRSLVQELLISAGEDIRGRMLLLDGAGNVLFDTAGQLIGSNLSCTETEAVLLGGKPVASGVHDEKGVKVNLQFFFSGSRAEGLYGYWSAAVARESNVTGAVLLIAPIRDMMSNLDQLQRQVMLIFAAVALVVLAVSLIFTTLITKPVKNLTSGIRTVAKGDFSSRVAVTGSGEMRQLAEAFNTMSERIESLDASRNQFVSNASHELKTPLATMKIMIESLIYQPDMDRDLRVEFMTDIDREIDRLTAIVSDLLTLVRIDSQNIRLSRENLSLAALVKENEHRLLPIAEQKKQKISLTLSDPCDMYADKSKLTQVIYNLMENAVKYTQAGGSIKVTLQRIGRDAHLVVTDNGPGIPKENLPYIFDRFYRVDKARDRMTGGTGLGLSIVHQLVLLHSGSIRVESEEGAGTSFILDLPLHQG